MFLKRMNEILSFVFPSDWTVDFIYQRETISNKFHPIKNKKYVIFFSEKAKVMTTPFCFSLFVSYV